MFHPGFFKHLRIWSHITETTIFSRGCFGYYQVHICIKRSQWYLEEFPSYQGDRFCIWTCFTRSFTWIRSDIEFPFFFVGVIVSSIFSQFPHGFFCSFSNLETCPTKTHKIFWVPKLRFQILPVPNASANSPAAAEPCETVWSLSELNKRMNKYFIGGFDWWVKKHHVFFLLLLHKLWVECLDESGFQKKYGMFFFLYSYFENNVCVILMIILRYIHKDDILIAKTCIEVY